MSKAYNKSWKVLAILIMCTTIFFISCNNANEINSVEKIEKPNTNEKIEDLNVDVAISDIDQKVEDERINSLEEGEKSSVEIHDVDSYLNYYFVIGDGVRLREGASIDSRILLQLNHGAKVASLGNESDWIKMRINNIQGYIRSDFVSIQEPKELSTIEASDQTTEDRTGEITDITTGKTIGKTTEQSSDNTTEETTDKSIDNRLEETEVITVDTADVITNPKIVVKKSDRTLELWDGDSLYGSYPIGLGWDPLGDKYEEGDGRTPEGTYYVCTRNNLSRFYLSLGVSYPNIEDAQEAVETGVIDQTTYQQITDAINQKKQPPWNTAMGGEIMIHGHGSQSDWTAGCVAVENNIMDILWDYCPLGTPIIINP